MRFHGTLMTSRACCIMVWVQLRMDKWTCWFVRKSFTATAFTQVLLQYNPSYVNINTVAHPIAESVFSDTDIKRMVSAYKNVCGKKPTGVNTMRGEKYSNIFWAAHTKLGFKPLWVKIKYPVSFDARVCRTLRWNKTAKFCIHLFYSQMDIIKYPCEIIQAKVNHVLIINYMIDLNSGHFRCIVIFYYNMWLRWHLKWINTLP